MGLLPPVERARLDAGEVSGTDAQAKRHPRNDPTADDPDDHSGEEAGEPDLLAPDTGSQSPPVAAPERDADLSDPGSEWDGEADGLGG